MENNNFSLQNPIVLPSSIQSINPLTMSINTWNVNGLSTNPDKLRLILDYMYRNKDIFLLQEIHHPTDFMIKRLNSAAPITLCKKGEPSSSGTSITIPLKTNNINLITSFTNKEDNNHRFFYQKIQWFEQNIILINIYAPVQSTTERATFFNNILNTIRNFTDPIILGGDFNCCINPDLDYTNITTRSRNSADLIALRELLTIMNLHDAWRLKHPNKREGTCGLTRGTKNSRLDKIYISECLINQLDSAEIIYHPASDHNICNIKLKKPKQSKHLQICVEIKYTHSK
jgi:exonuclease III